MDSKNNGSSNNNDDEARLRERLRLRQAARQRDSGRTGEPHADTTTATTNDIVARAAGSITSSTSQRKESTTPQHLKESEERHGSRQDRGLYSESTSTGRGHGRSPVARASGKKRKREKRRMNRQAKRRGLPQPFGTQRHHRGPSFDISSRGAYRDRGPYPDWRGPPPDYRRSDYDYSEYRNRGRSRGRSNPRRSDSRSRPRTPSSVSSGSGSRSPSRSRRRRSRSRGSAQESRRSVEDWTRPRGRIRSRGDGDRYNGESITRGESDDRRGGSSARYERGRYGHERPPDTPPRRRRSYSSSSGSDSSDLSSSDDEQEVHQDESAFSKDQRTVFVTQLVLRATERDIRRYFRRKVGCKVKEVILLKDRRTGGHKGCAYVEMGRIADVNKAVSMAGQPPDFQRFPILVKASEAEKNYSVPASSAVLTASMMGNTTSKPTISKDGKIVESQKAYVGNLDQSVNESHLFSLFSQFGQLEKVTMQMDPTTQTSRGYAFLSFRDPKEANLAIQTMSNQILAGRPMKTGWANQTSSIPGVTLETSDELPADASERTQKALAVVAQLTGSSSVPEAASISATAMKAIDYAMGDGSAESSAQSGPLVPTVAQARASLAAEQSTHASVPKSPSIPSVSESKESSEKSDSKPSSDSNTSTAGSGGEPTRFILVHNMFDKDEETEVGWANDIKEEFEEECTKFGKIKSVVVMSEESGGKIYAAFDNVGSAEACANKLAGRWFDKRQLRVDYVLESDFPGES